MVAKIQFASQDAEDVTFGELEAGDVFLIGDDVLIKTDEEDEDGDTYAVSLDGTLYRLQDGKPVNPRRATVTVSGTAPRKS